MVVRHMYSKTADVADLLSPEPTLLGHVPRGRRAGSGDLQGAVASERGTAEEGVQAGPSERVEAVAGDR